jgi:hypothetical protein
MNDCVKRIVETSKNAVNSKNAKEMIAQAERMAWRMSNEGMDYDDALSLAVKKMQALTKSNIAKQKANMARNVVIKADQTQKISGMVDSGLSIKDAIRADLEGINSPIEGTRDSLDVFKSAVEHSYFSRFFGELNREGLIPVLNSKTLDEEIGKELWALSEGKSGATPNEQAAKIAQIIHKTKEGQRLRMNKAGADVEALAGYVMPQRHDIADMMKAGQDKWVEDMLPLVDEQRTFGGDYEDLTKALRSAYNAMVTGLRLNDPVDGNAKLFQFSGPSNLAKRVSSSRQIHFKNYESWKKWNDTYGSKDINEGIIDSIRNDANNIALMERYGTNPEAMIKAIADDVKAKYRNKAAKEGEQGIDAKITDLINSAMDKNLIAAHPTVARVGSNIRAFNNVTSLGGAVLSSVTDIPMKSLEYQFQGKNWLGSAVQPFIDVAEGFKSKADKAEFSSLMGTYMESMVGDVGGRFSSNDNLSNKASKVQRVFFKLNGLAWWTDTHKFAMGKTMAHHLGLKKNVAYDDLDADTLRLFGNYNIGRADWDAMRAKVKTLDDGREYLLAEFVDGAAREKLIGYFVDRANTGVLTPTAREQRIATMGTQRGTPAGEFVRLVMQFKSFPIAVVTKVWGRAIYGKGKADVPAMAYLMLNTMLFGYVAGAMKDLIKGRTPKDPNKLETVYASLAQGGGLGILGDVLLQDGSGFGRSLSQTLAGPTFGRLDDIFKIYSAAVRGEGSASQAVRTGVSLIPFNNLFYTRAALDQMLLYQIQEDLNHGYLRRMERNLEKTYGQQLLFK